MDSTTTYIETSTPIDHEKLKEFLAGQEHRVLDIRNVSTNCDGVVLTDTLLRGHWKHDTGQVICTGECVGTDRQHTEWEDLTPSQQQGFANAMASFMLGALDEHFVPIRWMEDNEEFDSIALRPC